MATTRSRPSTSAIPGSSSVQPPSSSAARIELPPYEKPLFPLNPTAQRALSQLSQTHPFKKLDSQLDDAAAKITDAAGDINERLAEQERNARKRSARTAASRPDSTQVQNEEQATAELDAVREKIMGMTERLDKGLRKVIDGKHGLQAIRLNLESLAPAVGAASATQTTTAGGRSSARTSFPESQDHIPDFDPTDPTTGAEEPAPLDIFRSRLEDANLKYQAHSLRARYAENNDYRNFKNIVHNARHPGEDVPLAHADEWFEAEEGTAPAPGVTKTRSTNKRDRDADGESDDDDDDIAVSRANISTKCPLTLREFVNPLTSKKCPHSFEAGAILELMRHSRIRTTRGPRGGITGGVPGVQCPVTGCSELLTKEDLREDPVLQRKIKAIQRSRQLEDEDEDGNEDGPSATQRTAVFLDDEDEDADVDMPPQSGRRSVPSASVKREVAPSAAHSTADQVLDVGNGYSEGSEADEGHFEDDMEVTD